MWKSLFWKRCFINHVQRIHVIKRSYATSAQKYSIKPLFDVPYESLINSISIVCNFCAEMFSQKRNFTDHVHTTHVRKTMYVLCEETLWNNIKLVKLQFHLDAFDCMKCAFTVSLNGNLLEHVGIHCSKNIRFVTFVNKIW